jgi:hypothetical protein
MIFDLIMKMDDESARMFSYIVISDVLEETISKNLPMVQKRVNEIVEKRLTTVMRATARAVVKHKDGFSYAWALSEISKAQQNPYDRGYRFRESDFSRDPGTGRFRTKVVTSQVKPIHDRTASSMGIPTKAEATQKSTTGKLSAARVAAYQDQYRQLANFMNSVVASSDQAGDQDVIAHIKSRTGQKGVYTTTVSSTNPNAVSWDPAKEDLVGLDARPNALTAGGAYFGLASALGRGTEQRQQGFARGLNYADANLGSFAAEWTKPLDGSERNSSERTFGRISSASRHLTEMAEPGSKLQSAARLAQFVGDHGSEAEAVFGPTARKTAYRYRGITREPDQELVHAYDNAVKSSEDKFDPDVRTKIRTAQTRAINARRVQMAQEANKGRKFSDQIDANAVRIPEEERVQILNSVAERVRRQNPEVGPVEAAAGRDVAVRWLNQKGRKPKKGLYNLQLASGNTPPSQGVLIDAKGKIVAQAVGYGDDHYLPFNLKQLGKLKGGEYVRSRSVGGITTEDVYTGLMTGAKRVTVTSRSGTFTMEFQDDIKGRKRAFNDKARRMTGRYASLLDAVQSHQVDAQTLDPTIAAGIRQQVREELTPYGASPREVAQVSQKRIQEFKENPEMSENDEKLVNTLMAMDPARMSRDAESFRRDTLNRIAAEKEYKFRLNGFGYAAALDALEEQFPYYLKADSVPTREEHEIETEIDRGYVEPGRNRPTAAAAGLFGGAAKPNYTRMGGKFSASEADYQSGIGPRPAKGAEATVKAPATDAKPEVKEEQKDTAARTAPNYVSEARMLQARMKQQVELGEATAGKQGLTNFGPDDRSILNYTPEDFQRPEKQALFDELVKRVVDSGGGSLLGDALPRYRAAAGHIGRQKLSQELIGVWTDKPLIVDHAAYQPGATPAQKKIERDQLDNESRGSVTTNRPLSALDEGELSNEHRVLAGIKSHIELSRADDPEARAAALKGLGVHTPATPALTRILENPELIGRQMELVHRMRSLQEGMPKEDRGVDEGEIVAPSAPSRPVASKEETQAAVGDSVDKLIFGAARATKYYADMGTPEGDEIADNITVLRRSLEENRGALANREDLQNWIRDKEMNQTLQFVLRGYHEWQKSQPKPPEEPMNRGNILG